VAGALRERIGEPADRDGGVQPMRLLFALILSLIASAAQAQNQTCPTRALGDNTNACASTAFVFNAFANATFTNIVANTVTAPLIAGGSAANSTLTLESTSGAGTTDSIAFQTGSQTQRGLIQTDGSFLWSTGTASINVKTYDNITNSGKTAWQITNSDNTALTALEKYSAWIGATSQGTGDSTPAATTFALGLSAIKSNWTTTTVVGEYGGLNVVARGGHNNAVSSGDTSAITTNVGVSFSNNFSTQYEGVGGYLPGGSTTGSLFINAQIGSVRSTGLDTGSNTGIGFFAQAQNGVVGHAFSASNLCASPKFGTCGKWLDFLNYLYDDGTHTAYNAFNVNQLGQLTLAGFGTAGTNQKTIRVGTSVTNNLEIINAGNTAQILTLTDGGQLNVNGALVSGAAGVGSGVLQLTGTTSGALSINASATGGHIFWSSSSTPTANSCAGFALASGSDDINGVVTFTSATSCSITWGTAYAAAPFCTITPNGAATTFSATPSTSGLSVSFGTAQTSFTYLCWNS
jgi:hypothetical protein